MTVLLIAEDNDDVSAVLRRLFTHAGFTVLHAPDGTKALQLARQSHPDVVLTDLDMPGLSGLQLCQAIRADPELGDVPVGILSGSLRPGDPRAVAVHACGVWLKPFTNSELVAAIRELAMAGSHHHRGASSSSCPLAAAPA